MKTQYGLGIATALLGLSQICSAALIAEWNFNNSGDLGNDSAGSFDLVTGADFAPPTYGVAGKVGGAAGFVDDSGFTTPTNIYPNGDFTFSGWFKPSDANFTTAITPFSRRAGFELYASGGTWRARVWKHDLTSDYKVGPAIVVDEWVHIVLWYNSTDVPDGNGNYTGSFRLWVNGVNQGGVNDAEYNANDTYDMHLGSKATADYRGLMDEVRIYDTPLAAADIRALANRPVAEWTFDDSGDLGNDSGSGYVGAGFFDLSTTAGQVPPTYDAAGRLGGAAVFTNSCEFVTPADIYPNGDFTFSAWFKPADTTFANAVRSYSSRGGFQIYASGGTWRARVFKQDTTWDLKVGSAIVADEWVHIALYYRAISGPDASGNYTGTFRMWVNGVNIGGVDYAEYAAPDSYIMHMGDKWGDYRGLMDEVRLYDYALGAEEIRALAFPDFTPEVGDISLAIAGSDAIISWLGTNDVSYALQTKGNLVGDPSWSNAITGIAGVSGAMSATSTATAAESFYRVVIEPGTDFYVAPSALGDGWGADAGNAAAYTDTAFWGRVQNTLASGPVTVLFLDGNYSSALSLGLIGNVDNTLTLAGMSSNGVVFDAPGTILFELKGCQNMLLEQLNFTGAGTGYAFRITKEDGGTVSSNITVRNCDWYDMEDIYYGASGVHYGSHHVRFENCTFRRIGFDGHAHMMYHSYNADHVAAINCHFEDCSGVYVRFRAGSDYAVVSGCTFATTQTYPNRSSISEIFVEFPVFNDVDPGDEYFALDPVVTNNTFLFHGSEPPNRYGIRFLHSGYDPPGMNHLMTAAEGAVLEGSDAAAKKNLLKNNCGIDFDEIVIDGNTWSNETRRILFSSAAAYGATSKGWDSEADISDVVFGP